MMFFLAASGLFCLFFNPLAPLGRTWPLPPAWRVSPSPLSFLTQSLRGIPAERWRQPRYQHHSSFSAGWTKIDVDAGDPQHGLAGCFLLRCFRRRPQWIDQSADFRDCVPLSGVGHEPEVADPGEPFRQDM